jgi:hypothetical protein
MHCLQDVVFPLYDQVKPEHVVPGMRALLAQLHKEIDALEASVTPSWEGLVEPLEKLTDRHQRTWGIVSHLKVGFKGSGRKAIRGFGWCSSRCSAVNCTDELRAAVPGRAAHSAGKLFYLTLSTTSLFFLLEPCRV